MKLLYLLEVYVELLIKLMRSSWNCNIKVIVPIPHILRSNELGDITSLNTQKPKQVLIVNLLNYIFDCLICVESFIQLNLLILQIYIAILQRSLLLQEIHGFQNMPTLLLVIIHMSKAVAKISRRQTTIIVITRAISVHAKATSSMI